MPQPKRKHTRRRRDKRRASNWTLEADSLSRCSNCRQPRVSHRVCPHCGFYAGKLVNPPKVKKKEGPQAGGQASS